MKARAAQHPATSRTDALSVLNLKINNNGFGVCPLTRKVFHLK